MDMIASGSDTIEEPLAMAIGTFDGIHLGHQQLIKILKDKALSYKCASAIYTFDKHPLNVLCPDKAPALLMNNKQKLSVLRQYGIDYIILNEFNKAFADIPADKFVNNILFGLYHVKSVIVGFDFTFGYKGQGDAQLLKDEGQKRGIDVVIVPPVKVNGVTVSSSLIRRLVNDGCVEEAARYLGRPFALLGEVHAGHKMGHKLGFPTANLTPDPGVVVPRSGVYATEAVISGMDGTWKAVTNIGTRPTFNDTHISIETHILDYDGQLYGQELEIRFISRLRDEMLFSNPERLARQIREDIDMAREVLENLDKASSASQS
jgi:riboflavin kinase/FMN adenylyltransferase